MSEYRDFVYIRTDPVPMGADQTVTRQLWRSDLAKTRAHLRQARLNGFTVHRRNAVTERVNAAVAASGRTKFVKLLRKLGPGTGLVVWKLDGLGRDAADILKTIAKVRACGAEIYCMDLYNEDISENVSLMKALEAVATLDRMTGKTRRVADALGRGVAGGRIGRPPSLDDATQAKVRACLKDGETVSNAARRFNTSRQTIIRIRDASR